MIWLETNIYSGRPLGRRYGSCTPPPSMGQPRRLLQLPGCKNNDAVPVWPWSGDSKENPLRVKHARTLKAAGVHKNLRIEASPRRWRTAPGIDDRRCWARSELERCYPQYQMNFDRHEAGHDAECSSPSTSISFIAPVK